MNPMRITYHNGRSGSAKHNDRTFDLNKAAHIDQQQAENNLYCTWLEFEGDTTERSFEEAEEIFYKRHFGKGLAARNDRYLKNRHPERVKDMKEYMTAYQTKPEETLIYVGNKGNSVEDPDLLKEIYGEYLDWRSEAYPQLALLDVSFHLDEATLHIHERSVWIGHDKDGNEIPGQNKALAEMGVERPDMDKPDGRYNNAKMTFTADCRAHLQEICREHGLDIEDRPRERSKRGLSLIEYKAQQENKKLTEAQKELTHLESQKEHVSNVINAAEMKFKEADKQLKAVNALMTIHSERERRMATLMNIVKPFNDSNMTLLEFFEQKEKELINRAVEEIPETPEIADIEEER